MIRNSNASRIFLDDVEVPDITDLSLEVSSENIIVTTKPTKGNIERIPGVRDSTVSFDCLLDTQEINRYTIGQRVGFKFGSATRHFRADNSYLQNISYVGTTDGAPRYNIVVETSGGVSYVPGLSILYRLSLGNQALCFRGETLCAPAVIRLGTLCIAGNPLTFRDETLSGPRI